MSVSADKASVAAGLLSRVLPPTAVNLHDRSPIAAATATTIVTFSHGPGPRAGARHWIFRHLDKQAVTFPAHAITDGAQLVRPV
jgi:hypothetical protein